MTVTGINGDLYYTDNPIFITFTGINPDTKYIEIFPSTSGPQSGAVRPQRLYTQGQSNITIDIASIAKMMMRDVDHNTDYTTLTKFVALNNWASITFSSKEALNDGSEVFAQSFTRTFVRGGIKTYEPNQMTSVNKILSPTPIIPQWGGYPIDFWSFNAQKQMTKSNTDKNFIQTGFVEQRKIKGCDPLYFKFRNSLGGYSYWLFENSEEETNNKNLGTFSGQKKLIDFGNEVGQMIEVTSKVPKRFYPIIADLIGSGEIYIYVGVNVWERVISKNNKVSQNKFNTNEKVKFKFDIVNRYNPSLIW